MAWLVANGAILGTVALTFLVGVGIVPWLSSIVAGLVLSGRGTGVGSWALVPVLVSPGVVGVVASGIGCCPRSRGCDI